MSDYNIFIRNRSRVYLGGPPLVKMATGEDADDEELGGGEMHAGTSGLADYLADDEPSAIRMARSVIAHLNWRKQIDGRRSAFRVTPGPAGTVFVQDARGELRFEELPRFPEPGDVERAGGGYSAPMPGKVLDVRVQTGDAVTKGQALLTMEAMKMEHLVTASGDGVVAEVRVVTGQQVDAGQVLVVIDAREDSPAHGR
jgi:biotin carboxyl carrier protein